MTLRERLSQAARELEGCGIEDPQAELEWFAADFLGVSRPSIRLAWNEPASPRLEERLRSFVEFRRTRRPFQHWSGFAPFLDWEFEVSPAVLIPRPETEILALRAESILRTAAAEAPRILDVGTGSGCLALHLAMRFPRAEVEAWDVSPAALEVAARNGRRLGASRVGLVLQDLFQAGRSRISGLDLVVSNPPYIPAAEVRTLAPEVRDHEPLSALDGGADGLDCYRHLASVFDAWLRPGGTLVLEHGDGQSAAIAALFRSRGSDVEAEKDLSGRERILIVRTPTATGP